MCFKMPDALEVVELPSDLLSAVALAACLQRLAARLLHLPCHCSDPPSLPAAASPETAEPATESGSKNRRTAEGLISFGRKKVVFKNKKFQCSKQRNGQKNEGQDNTPG